MKIDPIPEKVKQHFYSGIAPPNFTKDYHAVGFDADHCLVKYHVQNTIELLAKIQLKDLHECAGWPEEIMDIDLSPDSKWI